MTFDEFDNDLNVKQAYLGQLTRGDANAYVLTAQETSDWLTDIENKSDELRKTYAKPVEMTVEQKCYLVARKNGGESFYQVVNYQYWKFGESIFENISEQDLMRAWLHPDLIVVKE